MRVHSGPKKSMLRVGSGTVLLVMMAFKTAYKITLFSMAICDMLMQKKKKGNFKRFMPLDFFTFIPPNFWLGVYWKYCSEINGRSLNFSW